MSKNAELLVFPTKADTIPVPRTHHDLIRLLAHSMRSLDALACHVAAADIENVDKLRLLQVVKRLAGETAVAMITLEEAGGPAADLISQIQGIVNRLAAD